MVSPRRAAGTGWMPAGRALAGALALVAVAAVAAPPPLELPVRCELGRVCAVQNYFDRDAAAGYADYMCGHLSYDGHTGTDFRVPDLEAMRAGVEVIAAAAGVVAATRDGEPDMPIGRRGADALNGKDAGNAVRIDHGDGWETQYSHLRRGSVRVRKGQSAAVGDVLGLVGLSGRTEFPHVHFSVLDHGKPVDPFAADAAACGGAGPMLWSPAARQALGYRPTGLLTAGFVPAAPTRAMAEAGDAAVVDLPATAATIGFYVGLFGMRKDDRWRLELLDPDARRLGRKTGTIASNMAVWYVAISASRAGADWTPGFYSAVFSLERNEDVVVDERRDMWIR